MLQQVEFFRNKPREQTRRIDIASGFDNKYKLVFKVENVPDTLSFQAKTGENSEERFR
jgi:hypothetical protein